MRTNESICKHYMSDLIISALTIIDSIVVLLSTGYILVLCFYTCSQLICNCMCVHVNNKVKLHNI